MRTPWTPLTEWLSLPFGSSSVDDGGDPEADEAWTETAARLGLVRLGWRPVGREGDFDLAYPCERALVKAQSRAGIMDGQAPAGAAGVGAATCSGGAQEAVLAVEGGELVAAAPPGALPPRKALLEVGTLAAAMASRRAARERLRRAERAAAQGRNAAAAAHDLRNELTRAVLYATRDEGEDAGKVLEALTSARDLAQTALGSGDQQRAPRPTLIRLKDLLVDEARAATAAARDGAAGRPTLRVKCRGSLYVLAPRSAISRAVRNLLTNALEAAACGPQRPGAVTVQVAQPDRSPHGLDLDVVVSDDGKGMAPAALKVFLDGGLGVGVSQPPGSPQLDPAKPSSTGLGTASLRLALREAGAGLRVESAPGMGTKATLSVRSASTEGDPVVLIDGDPRRARARAATLVGAAPMKLWIFDSAVGALAAVRAGRITAVHCAVDAVRPELRAVLADACATGGVPLNWLQPGREGRPLERPGEVEGTSSPVGAA